MVSHGQLKSAGQGDEALPGETSDCKTVMGIIPHGPCSLSLCPVSSVGISDLSL